MPGDRFALVCVVVNLTGVGNGGRRMPWRTRPKTGETAAIVAAVTTDSPDLQEFAATVAGETTTIVAAETTCEPIEWNLETLDAFAILEGIARGDFPLALLAWMSLMKNGDDPAILRRWREVAELEKDPIRKADLGLVVLFADLTKRTAIWQKALEGFNVIESPTLNKWIADAEARAEAKATIKSIVRILEKKFSPVPPVLIAKIEATTALDTLQTWVVLAATVDSLDKFRQDAGI